MFKGIVFDLDGTLVDSPLCFKSIRSQLEIPNDQYILEYLDQLPLKEKLEKLKLLEEIELIAAKQAVPFPRALTLLEELRALGIKIGIFTRNCRTATNHIIQSHGMKINMVVTRNDAPAKPNPEGLKLFLSQWNLEGTELLYIGDYRFDIECGKEAGVRTGLFTNGQEPLEKWSSDYVIPHFSNFWENIPKVTLTKSQVGQE